MTIVIVVKDVKCRILAIKLIYIVNHIEGNNKKDISQYMSDRKNKQ